MYIHNKKIFRKVLPLEATFIRSMGAIIAVVAQVSGPLDEDKFKLAVCKLKNMYLALNCVLTWDENGESWFEEKDIDSPIIIKEKTSENCFEEIIPNEWNKSFDLINGPLYRFILLKSADKSDIIFVCHHILSDGIGLTIIIDNILRLMNDENLIVDENHIKGLPSIKNLNEFTKKTNFNISGSLYKYTSFFLNYRWRRSKIYLPPEDIILSHRKYFDAIEYIPLVDEFTEEETLLFIKKCKENKVTVTSAMAMAFLACRNEIDKEHENNKQIIPVDLRKYLNGDLSKAINCYSSSINIDYSYDTSKTFWENTKIYNNKIKYALDSFSHIKKIQVISNFPTDFTEASILAQRFHSLEDVLQGPFAYSDKLNSKSNHVASIMAKYSQKLNTTFCLSNMGIPKVSSSYGNLNLEKIFIYPSGVTYPPLTVLITTVTLNNRLFLAFHIVKKKNDTEDKKLIAIKLKERYKEFLTKDIFYN